MPPFQIIQAPMGIGVSGWPLARAVSSFRGGGQLGVVASSALDTLLTRRLQRGDSGGHLRRALGSFPIRRIAEEILSRYYAPKRMDGTPFIDPPPFEIASPRHLVELTVAANFAEIFLAKEGHSCPVGINFLEKVQLPLLPSIYGAMLAGVDYVLISAGPTNHVATAIDAFCEGRGASYPVSVIGQREKLGATFDPRMFLADPPKLAKPRVFAMVASAAQAHAAGATLDGVILQAPNAGGHTAPRAAALDVAELQQSRVPFYFAGGQGLAGKLREAQALGAAGIMVGTAFEFCEESGLAPELKKAAIALARARSIEIITDADASPTGFPLKVLRMETTLSNREHYQRRTRICDLSHLRRAVRLSDGSIAYRCPAESIADYLRKGGVETETSGKQCLCNAMFANLDLGSARGGVGGTELPLITASEDAQAIGQFLAPGATCYRASDVLNVLLT